ncbi:MULTISPECIES: putative protein N(5)-glutamine methyltransferase [Tsukamurella]|uniref:Release factor glutamine methyltransferase n=1 Tax=Tsukamurella strandjordii TaxID=147577 RepID=A0AA90N8M7_9ACTN|nr:MULTISPECIES: putative protein N(5)-glutamine methyltransferase [Tsukamurella]MDP0397742.1 putative protein N(5)-glutamine methyltransferase [Tsukamurella strandjordii]GIZ99183.1 N5-glutamine S-adenosyl-L-methionine-dependent methyltransferase [Tsukamurella sp. TY48]
MDVIDELRAAGCVFADQEAELLASTATGAELEDLVRRRCCGEPLEHLLGWVEFRGRRLAVGPGTFVPRRRTELLAELADDARPAVLVELCCGVAPVAATCAAEEAYAVDIDPVPLEYARLNAPGATVLTGDLYASLPRELSGRVDVIAANAPYVPTAAIATMPAEAREHEPRVALDGGADGLAVHRRIAAEARMWLADGGVVLIETGRYQAEYTERLLRAAGFAARVVTDADRGSTVAVGVLEPAH